MNTYVSDWAQEVYGDVRSYAVAGSSVTQRRDSLTDYLEHPDLLAAAGGAVSGTASAFFSQTASPLGSAAWQWDGSFGWTLVDAPLMPPEYPAVPSVNATVRVAAPFGRKACA